MDWRVMLMNSDGQSIDFACAPGLSIPAAAEAAGYRLRTSCKRGGCGICHARLLSGSIDYVAPVSAARLAAYPLQTVFVCRARPTADVQLHVGWEWQRIDRTPLSRRMLAGRRGELPGDQKQTSHSTGLGTGRGQIKKQEETCPSSDSATPACT